MAWDRSGYAMPKADEVLVGESESCARRHRDRGQEYLGH